MELGTKQVFITGASGWLGKSFLAALANGLVDTPSLSTGAADIRIHCLVLPGDDVAAIRNISPSVSIIAGDIRDPDSCRQFLAPAEDALVVHTAAVIHPRRTKDFFSINEYGTRNLLHASAERKVARFIAISSNSPCGCNPHSDHLFDESSPYHPYAGYGRSKMAMERLIQDAHHSMSVRTTILRAPWFYGPYQPARQTQFFRMIRDGKMPMVGSGDNRRSMIYLDNLCQAILLAATTPQAIGSTYWIADAEPYSMAHIVATVAKVLQRDFDITSVKSRLRLPNVISDTAEVADRLIQRAGIYHTKIHVLSEMNKTIACSIAKARRELGYNPAISLEEGMRRSIQWCLQQGILN